MKQDIWDEGKYIDMWTVNHTLSGFILAGWLGVFGVSTPVSIVISSILFIGWEVFEYLYKIEETPNQVVDIIANYVGLIIYYRVSPSLESHLPSILATASVLFLFLEIVGYVAYLKRSHHG